jgi:hypothetical protein
VAPGPHLGTGTDTCFHPSLKLSVTGGIGEDGKVTFGGIKNVLVCVASGPKLAKFIWRKRVDGIDDVKVRILGVAHGGLFVAVSPGQ